VQSPNCNLLRTTFQKQALPLAFSFCLMYNSSMKNPLYNLVVSAGDKKKIISDIYSLGGTLSALFYSNSHYIIATRLSEEDLVMLRLKYRIFKIEPVI
jgi:hypothetical protein